MHQSFCLSIASQSRSPRGIVQCIKHSPGTLAAGVQTQTLPKYIVLLSSGVSPPCALSLTMPGGMCSSMNTCQLSLGGKKVRNKGKILAAPSVGRNTDIRAMYGRKEVKKLVSQVINTKCSSFQVNLSNIVSVYTTSHVTEWRNGKPRMKKSTQLFIWDINCRLAQVLFSNSFL